MVLGNIAILLGSGFLGSVLTSDDGKNIPILGDVLSGAAKFVNNHGKDGKGASGSDQHTAQVMSQVNILREEIKSLSSRQVSVGTTSSGSGAFTITAVVVAGVIVYGYIKWKGWKISDMMWVTKRGLSDACNVVGNQLNEVSDSVHVTKRHLAGRIDRVDASLDETQEIIEGTRDEVKVIHVDLSAFQKELEEVNRTVEIWGSKLGTIEHTQDRTVRATEALIGFSQQIEHGQNANICQLPSLIPPAIESSSEKIVRRLLPPPPESSPITQAPQLPSFIPPAIESSSEKIVRRLPPPPPESSPITQAPQLPSFIPPAIESSSEKIVRRLPPPPPESSPITQAPQEKSESSNRASVRTPTGSTGSSWLSGLSFLRR